MFKRWPNVAIQHGAVAAGDMIPETLKQLSLEVSQYFLDFLESDFKRQQAPRRRVILQTSSGFKAGMALAGYRDRDPEQTWARLSLRWSG